MNLNFAITKEVNIDSNEVVNRIEAFLTQNGYKIIGRDLNNIVFTEDNGIRYGARADYYKRVNEGKFKIAEKFLGVTNLTLNYKVAITAEVIVLTILFLAGFFVNYGFFILYGVFLLNFIIKLYCLHAYTIGNIITP